MAQSKQKPSFGVYLCSVLCHIVGFVPWYFLKERIPAGDFVDGWTALVFGWMLGVPCGLLLAAWVPIFVRHTGYRWFCVGIVVMYSVGLTGPGLVRYWNMALDQSPRVSRSVLVLDYNERRRRPDLVTLLHWDPGEGPFTVVGSGSPGVTMTVYSHTGRLGFEWVELPDDAGENDDRNRLR